MGYPSHEDDERYRLRDLQKAINARVTTEEIEANCTPSNEIVNISKFSRKEMVGLMYSWAELDILIQKKTGMMLFEHGQHERIMFVLKDDKIEVIDANHSNGNWEIQEVGTNKKEIDAEAKAFDEARQRGPQIVIDNHPGSSGGRRRRR